MLHEFALDPEAVEDLKDLRFLQEAFGLPKGRLLAELPEGWAAAVFKRLGGAGGLNASKVTERLVELKRCMTARPSNPIGPFLTVAQVEHQRCRFHAILTADRAVPEIPLIPFQEVTESPLWQSPRSIAWPRERGTILKRLRVFGSLTRELHLIDPYFNLRFAGCRNFLEELLTLILEGRGREACHVRVHFHLSAKHTGSSIPIEDWTLRLNRLTKWRPLSVNISLWDDESFHTRFHNRYLLNDSGGIQFGDGLELQELRRGLDTASLLGEEAYGELWRRVRTLQPVQNARIVVPERGRR
ncbi:hypothetical protein [Mesoterricola silvestris]|uniref:Uncharacterized protein n=1 Tax=Mesoterricola silvestris TaxID=2927979 RepID=A0AA48K8R3_9BACT|nr:hypothetical protein [Mesoterricola silvestris]BDU71557.1 hypothetical protein METEAL_07310 [Mesoterricola silvestris]